MSLLHKLAFGLVVLFPAVAKADFGNIISSGSFSGGAVYQNVQSVHSYTLRRPELLIGTRVTLFANFLQERPGVVMLDVGETTAQCKVVHWKNHGVTLQLPRLGLAGPTNARLRIILPNGRVAKSVSVVLISQPSFVVHQETVAQPSPAPAPADLGTNANQGYGEFMFFGTER